MINPLMIIPIALFCFLFVMLIFANSKEIINENPDYLDDEDLFLIKRSDKTVNVPSRNHDNDAGVDIFSAEDIVIPSGEGRMIKTGLSLQIPKGHMGQINDRSSMGKKGLHIHGGIVDEPYRGEIKVIMWNYSKEAQIIAKNDKIAQIILIPVSYLKPIEVEKLNETQRGDKGFGSSGK